MKKIILGCLIAFFLVGCGPSEAEIQKLKKEEAEKIQLEKQKAEENKKQEDIKKVEDIIRYKLRDGDSAKFRNVIGSCGEVNSKNGFGAYAGFSRFAIDLNSGRVVFDNEYFPTNAKMICNKEFLSKYSDLDEKVQIAIDEPPKNPS